MSTKDYVFKPLAKLPLKCDWYTPQPLFYPKDSNSIIICTDCDDEGVFKYNLDNNNLEKLLEYSSSIQPTGHGQFIDYNNDTLHILDSMNDLHVTIDLKTKTINDPCMFNYGEIGEYPKSVEISSTKGDEIHIVADLKNHFKFDCSDTSLTKIDSKNNHDVYCLKLLYVESKKQIMVLGGDESDNIYYCNINQPYEWKLMNNIKMPHCVTDELFYDILLFGDIIMVFYFYPYKDIYDIWCMDLLHYKWYKSKYNVPKSISSFSYFIKSNNNNDIHLLDFSNQQHFMVNIHDLFSSEMIKQRRIHYEILVIGFVKNEEKNMILNIPWPLKQLILLLFPLFC